MTTMSLSKNLKQLRKDRGLSQQRVADRLDINRSTYNNYEHGLAEPNINTLIKISHFYNTPIDFIVK